MENIAEEIISKAQRQELDENSPLACQPEGLTVPLKRHQLSLLYQCLELENGKIAIESSVSRPARMRTRIGIIADKVGSGKSYTVLSLILSDSLSDDSVHQMVSSFAFDSVTIEYDDNNIYSNTNVIVIPHNLIKQWSVYCETIAPSLKVLNITTTKQLLSLHEKEVYSYDVILVSSTFFNSFASMAREKKYTFKRVFYDEVDSIPIRSCDKLNTRFTWFVTASYRNIMYPRGHGTWDHNMHRFVHIAEGVKSTGYIRTLFSQILPNLTGLLIAKNTDDYVDRAMQLPPINSMIVKCRTPSTITILDGIVDRNIMSALNANDVEGAIQYVNPSQRSSEDNIISILLEKYHRVAQNAKAMMRLVQEELTFDSDALREAELVKHRKTFEEYDARISNIIERIKSAEVCCICYDDICNKTIVDCCKNSFCFKCITTWLNTRQSCPSCRNSIGTKNFYIVSKASDVPDVTETSYVNTNEEIGLNEENDKYDNLKALLTTERPTGKFLIFSCYDTTLEKTEKLLRDQEIRYALLKGPHDVISSVVDRYKNGNLNVLLVNPRNYGSGLNLENTTDIVILHKFDSEIERQVIGRAQRLGRTSSLNVWYLLYQNEIPQAT